MTFDGETSDGVLYWMEDEDHFKFADDVVIDSTKRLYFNDEVENIFMVMAQIYI